MLFDRPADWVRENKPGLIVRFCDAPAQAGEVPGRAIIMVAHPDAAPAPLDAAFRTFVGLSEALAAERPLRHGEGVGLLHRYGNHLLRQVNGITLGGREYLAVPRSRGRWRGAGPRPPPSSPTWPAATPARSPAGD